VQGGQSRRDLGVLALKARWEEERFFLGKLDGKEESAEKKWKVNDSTAA